MSGFCISREMGKIETSSGQNRLPMLPRWSVERSKSAVFHHTNWLLLTVVHSHIGSLPWPEGFCRCTSPGFPMTLVPWSMIGQYQQLSSDSPILSPTDSWISLCAAHLTRLGRLDSVLGRPSSGPGAAGAAQRTRQTGRAACSAWLASVCLAPRRPALIIRPASFTAGASLSTGPHPSARQSTCG
jgi:hypothetical protein